MLRWGERLEGEGKIGWDRKVTQGLYEADTLLLQSGGEVIRRGAWHGVGELRFRTNGQDDSLSVNGEVGFLSLRSGNVESDERNIKFCLLFSSHT